MSKNSEELENFDDKRVQAELDKMSMLSAEFIEKINESGEKTVPVGKSPQTKEELLARRDCLLRLIAAKRLALKQTVIDYQSAKEKSNKATARHNDWEGRVEGLSKDKRLHVAYIGRLSRQALMLKEEAKAFERTAEVRYAASLIVGEFTLHRLQQETKQLLRMKARVRRSKVKLTKLYAQADLAEDELEEAGNRGKRSFGEIKNLSLQVVEDEGSLSGLGWIKENGMKDEKVEEKGEETEGVEEEEKEEKVEVIGKGKTRSGMP